MQFWHKFVSSQLKFVNDFIHFKLAIKIVGFFIFSKSQFFLPQRAQFGNCINLFCLVFLTFEFSFAIYFLQLTYASIITYNPVIFF